MILDKWVHTKAKFQNQVSEQLEEIGIKVEEQFDIIDFSFKLSSVFAFNHHEEGETTVRFENEFESIIILMDYDELKKLISENN